MLPGDWELERETGIGPATNSLEGCDSTIELLPLEWQFCLIVATGPQLVIAAFDEPAPAINLLKKPV